MTVKWSTRDGTAKGSEPGAATKGDFEKSSGELVFTDGENFQSITVTVRTRRPFLTFSELQLCEDGVNATRCHRDAVDVAS